ncbi:hypothetical protein D3C77_750060 [compost metagenome]
MPIIANTFLRFFIMSPTIPKMSAIKFKIAAPNMERIPSIAVGSCMSVSSMNAGLSNACPSAAMIRKIAAK